MKAASSLVSERSGVRAVESEETGRRGRTIEEMRWVVMSRVGVATEGMGGQGGGSECGF